MKDNVFGELISGLRTERGFSQFQLGRLVGVSDKAVSKWETGIAKPRMNVCVHLAEYLGVSLNVLLEAAGYQIKRLPGKSEEKSDTVCRQSTKDKHCPERTDDEEEKRIELHVHTGMSETDGVASGEDYIRRAAQWGHTAVAVTDLCVMHEMPRAFRAAKKYGVKLIPGCEGWMIPDEDSPMEDGRPVMLLAANRTGLVNLNRLVSLSHIRFFKKIPCMPRGRIEKYRDGILVGSACDGGEIVRAVEAKADAEELRQIAAFYDYFEVQPAENGSSLAREQAKARWLIKEIADLGDKTGKPVAAVGNTRYLDPQDGLCRAVIRYNAGIAEEGIRNMYYYRTTREMLECFAFLGESRARELVITAPQRIADRIDPGITLMPKDGEHFYPKIPGARNTVLCIARARACALYGDPLPESIDKRIMTETAMLDHGDMWSVLEITRRIVEKSRADGYPVGNRGCIASSLIARLCGITEVDPLPPHYRCPCCRKSLFPAPLPRCGTGYDLPEKDCPACGHRMTGDGFDIPPEAYFGVLGEKLPIIALNLADHEADAIPGYLREMFGPDRVFRPGMLDVIAPFRISRYIHRYMKDHRSEYTEEQVSGISDKIDTSKVNLSEHPAGIIIIPGDREINEFTPIQYPDDAASCALPVTHYGSWALMDILLKIDILHHDAPALLHLMAGKAGVIPEDIPLRDKQVLSLFRSPEALGVDERQILSPTGTYGIHEFSSESARNILKKMQPDSMEELIRLSGFTHGTGIWQDNAEKLLESGRARIFDCPAVRDDVMNDLIRKGTDRETAFRIMEQVRKGKKLTEDMEKAIEKAGMPAWYAAYCSRVVYMFPRAHAAAYVVHAVRIAWFKLRQPEAFYSASLELMRDRIGPEDLLRDETRLRKEILELRSDEIPSSPESWELAAEKEQRLEVLELILEMKARGISLPRSSFPI